MNSNNSLQVGLSPRGAMSSIRSMAAVIALGVCGAIGSAAVHAQATSGSLFGWAPVGDAAGSVESPPTRDCRARISASTCCICMLLIRSDRRQLLIV